MKIINRIISIPDFCLWIQDNNDNWDTSCGNCFYLCEGTPKKNEMKYCCYCGKKLKQKIFSYY